jgi:hypothetical protein
MSLIDGFFYAGLWLVGSLVLILIIKFITLVLQWIRGGNRLRTARAQPLSPCPRWSTATPLSPA